MLDTLEFIRKSIVGELNTINEYELYAEEATDEFTKQVFKDLSKEEQVHVGELLALIAKLNPEEAEEIKNGQEELLSFKYN